MNILSRKILTMRVDIYGIFEWQNFVVFFCLPFCNMLIVYDFTVKKEELNMKNEFLLNIVTAVICGIIANYIFQELNHTKIIVILTIINTMLHLYQMHQEHK